MVFFIQILIESFRVLIIYTWVNSNTNNKMYWAFTMLGTELCSTEVQLVQFLKQQH